MSFINELRDLEIPETVILKIVRHFGGNSIYIHKPSKVDLPARNVEIYRRFNGKNHRQLAIEFNLSSQHIHKIIKEERGKTCTSDCRQGAGFRRSCTARKCVCTAPL